MDYQGYERYFEEVARKVLSVDSPSGFTADAVEAVEGIVHGLGYPARRTNKGNLIITVEGRDNSAAVGLSAHLDTLGLIVRSITEEGQLMLAKIGGPILPTLDGEYCRVHTRAGKVYTGTILSLSPAAHVFDDASTRARDEKNMAVRIDEDVSTREEVLALGIRAGDFVCYEPKTTVTERGYLKSRFIDDKGSVAILLTLLKCMGDKGLKPRYKTKITLTVQEEIGFGGATIPGDITELLVVDMGCVGSDLTCTERQVSICAKDTGGPYDYEMVTRLIRLAEENGVDYAVDMYPFYVSDAAALWRAGHDVRAALVGPGVHASHGMERTHMDGVFNTMKLVALYLDCK